MTSSSTRNCKDNIVKIILCIFAGALLLVGCEGPSTTVLPSEAADEHAEAIVTVDVPAASPAYLAGIVDALYSGESDPCSYIESELRSYSYEVTVKDGIAEAVSRAKSERDDICLIFACYGGNDEQIPASDTAAGAAALLEISAALSEFSGDLEIHYIFLPGKRDDTGPVHTYLTEMFTPDPERLIGAVVLGALGLNEASENEICCVDGRPTFMAEEINLICASEFSRECPIYSSGVGMQNALLRDLVPAALYTQKSFAEAGTILDCPSIIDYEDLAESADIISHTLALLMGENSPSMQAHAHYIDDQGLSDKGIYTWKADDLFLPFGKDPAALEAMTGLMGEPVSENTISTGSELLGYRFPMKWFDIDEVLSTDFYYISDALASVEIKASPAGLEAEDVSGKITAACGEDPVSSESPYGTMYEWVLPAQRVKITLTPENEGYDLSLTEYDTPVTVYPSDTLGAHRLESLYTLIIPEDDREDMTFEAYTDGFGATLGTLTQTSSSGNGRWTLGLDLDDALNADAAYKDKMITIGELARFYGEYLAKRDPPEYYTAYRSRFGGSEDDFAASFGLFSLACEPAPETGPAADPIRYFYDFDELVDFRDTVRANLE